MAQVDMELAQQQMMMQAQMMQAQQAQQGGMTAQQMPQPGAAPGFPEQLQGFNNNPAEGAPAPQEAYPAGTFEGQTGQSRGGEQGFEPGM